MFNNFSKCKIKIAFFVKNYGSNVAFYRDEKDFEVDAIPRPSSGKWGQ